MRPIRLFGGVNTEDMLTQGDTFRRSMRTASAGELDDVTNEDQFVEWLEEVLAGSHRDDSHVNEVPLRTRSL